MKRNRAYDFRIGKTVVRHNSPAWWGISLLVIAAFVAVMSIPGTIDAADGLMPR